MVTIISNPTTSIRLSIPSVVVNNTTSLRCNLQMSNNNGLSVSSSCSSKLVIGSWNQRKLGGFRTGKSVRRFVVRCGVTEIDQTQFSETVLKSELPVLVEFVADWCGPCRLISPAIDWASQEYQDKLKVVKINHDNNPQLIEEYKVYGLPALIIFKNGKEVPESRREGAMTKAKLKDYLDAFLDSAPVA